MVRFQWLSLIALTSFLSWGSTPTLSSIESITRETQGRATQAGRSVTLEEVLEAIGKAYPELRTNHTLMHESLSRQGASPEFPRAITFSPNGRFALTFNGDPNAAGFYELEMYEFSPDATLSNGRTPESFKFRRIIFEPRKDYPHLKEYQSYKTFPVVAPINESKCLGCHTSRPRPNWESYNRWEGNYYKDDRDRGGEKYRLGYQTPETDAFDSFYVNQASRSRYRFLQDLEKIYLTPAPRGYYRVPPSQYTQVVGYLNLRRVTHLILDSPNYAQFKYAIMGAIYDCENYEEFFPEAVRKKIIGGLSTYIDQAKMSHHNDANRYFLQYEENRFGKILYVFEGRKISIEDWSMSFRRSPYSFITPTGSFEGFLSSLLAEQDPDLQNFRVYSLRGSEEYEFTTDFIERYDGNVRGMFAKACQALKQKSLSALK